MYVSKGAPFFEREGVCRRQRALQVNSPPDKTSLYAPKKQKYTKIWRQRKTGSRVFVVSRFIAHTHEVLGSFSDSDVGAFVLIIL